MQNQHTSSGSTESYSIDIGRVASKLQVSEGAVSRKIRIAVSESQRRRSCLSQGDAADDNAHPQRRSQGEASLTRSPSLAASFSGTTAPPFYAETYTKRSSALTFGVPHMGSLPAGSFDHAAQQHTQQAPASPPGAVVSAAASAPVYLSGSSNTAGDSPPTSPPALAPVIASAAAAGAYTRKFSLLSTLDARTVSPRASGGGGGGGASPTQPRRRSDLNDGSGGNLNTTPRVASACRPTMTVRRGEDGSVLMTVEEPWSPESPAAQHHRRHRTPSPGAEPVDGREVVGGATWVGALSDHLPRSSDSDSGSDSDSDSDNAFSSGQAELRTETASASDTTLRPAADSALLRDESGPLLSSCHGRGAADDSAPPADRCLRVAEGYGSTTNLRTVSFSSGGGGGGGGGGSRRGSRHDDAPSGAPKSALRKGGRRRGHNKHVHFGEEAIKNISVVHRNDQLVMQVEYNRPVWTWISSIAAAFSFVLSWTLLCHMAYPSDKEGESAARTVALFAVPMHAVPAVLALVLFAATWRPSRYERMTLSNRRTLQRLATCGIAYGLGQALFAGSFMCSITATNGAAFAVLPVLAIYMWETLRQRIVSLLDGVGSAIILGGIAIVAIGEARRSSIDAALKWSGLGLAAAGAVAQSVYLVRYRRLRAQCSVQLLLVVTQAAAAVASAMLALGASAYSTPYGANATVGLFALRGVDLARTGGIVALMALAALLHSYVALYFDTITLAAWFAASGPLMVLCFHTTDLPHMEQTFEVLGGLSLIAGTLALVAAGYRHRRNVELAINVDSPSAAPPHSGGEEQSNVNSSGADQA